MQNAFPVYIGYDPREHEAAEVTKFSLLRHSSIPLRVKYLSQPKLKLCGLYKRNYFMSGNNRIDAKDGKPFSTEFSFSRFLVPALEQYDGWAMFVDCDFLFTGDIAELLAIRDDSKVVQCVKHNHVPSDEIKMDEIVQTKYHRKNWSSMFLINCGHEKAPLLSVRAVNEESGQWLHAFNWLPDDLIGEVPEEWNWLEGHSVKGPTVPKAIHYTRGGPWFEKYRDCDYAAEWLAERDLMNVSK